MKDWRECEGDVGNRGVWAECWMSGCFGLDAMTVCRRGKRVEDCVSHVSYVCVVQWHRGINERCIQIRFQTKQEKRNRETYIQTNEGGGGRRTHTHTRERIHGLDVIADGEMGGVCTGTERLHNLK